MRMSRGSDVQSEQAWTFGRFRLLGRRKQLLEGDKPVRLGSRAFDLLTALVQRAGEVVSRQELEACIWPKTIVEETSLRAHVHALRKALGDGRDGARFIANVPGRGYCFVAPVEHAADTGADSSSLHAPAPPHNLPLRLTRVIGRSQAIHALSGLVTDKRFVTITGPGGMGKTTVALAVAEDLLGSFADGVRLVELAPVADPLRLPGAVASTLQVSISSDDPLPALCAFLRDMSILIVLDNCEHVLEAAATLVERMLKSSAGVSILTTSREPLNAAGEWVYRLPSLEVPPDAVQVSSRDALSYPAVQLFVERAMQTSDGFGLLDTDAPVVCNLCRQLDGMPLAIELAAARVDGLGVRGLAAGLDDRMQLLTRGRRTAMPRHRAIRAVLDWSYGLLSAAEQTTLCRLSLFRTGFTLEAAAAVASGDGVSAGDIVECVMDLAVKSLISTEAIDAGVRYRMLGTTRAYGFERLLQMGNAATASRRHADYMLRLLTQAEADRACMTRAQWLARYGQCMDDVWAALEWCFSTGGDRTLGATLTSAALVPVYELGLLNEHHERIHRALGVISQLSPAQPVLEMRLNAALIFPSGQRLHEERPHATVVARMLELAEELGEQRFRIAAVYGLWGKDFRSGDYAAALRSARKISALAKDPPDPAAMPLSDRLLAQSHHFMGEHGAAKVLAEHVLGQPAKPVPLEYTSPVPHGVAMRIVLARIAWLQGRADRAVEIAEECMEQAAGHPFALTQALALAACPIALWRGDDDSARRLVDKLVDHSARHPSAYWQSWGPSYDAVLSFRESNVHGAKARAPKPVIQTDNPMELDCLATLAEELATSDALLRVEHGTVGWCAPEVLRAQAEAVLAQGTPQSVSGAESILMKALGLARRQGAVAWELRTATSLGRIWREQERTSEAREVVATALSRLTEGLHTADVRSARSFLECLPA